jgi:phospholipid-binding lipoprotein MlaA
MKGAKPVKKFLAAAVILAFFSVIGFFHPSFAMDREPGIYFLAQQSQEESDEKDEDFEEDDEYEDTIVQINDPLYRLNYEFFLINDGLYVAILRPMAKGYNAVVPSEIRICVKNFFYNLRFPIRFVNCLLQAKGRKAIEEFATFFLNSTVGFAGIGDVASHYESLPPSPEDLGQTLAVWGADDGFYIMYPILGPSSLRDSARFIDSFFLDPISWLDLDWKTKYGILAYDKFNELSLSIGDIDALREAALDLYVGMRDAYVEHRNKLIAE